MVVVLHVSAKDVMNGNGRKCRDRDAERVGQRGDGHGELFVVRGDLGKRNVSIRK